MTIARLFHFVPLLLFSVLGIWVIYALWGNKKQESGLAEPGAGSFTLKLHKASHLIMDSDQWIDSMQVIPLFFPGNAPVQAITSISDVSVTGNKIVLRSGKLQLLGFDLNGNFLASLIPKGEGPGEAFQILDYVIEDGKVYVLQSANPNIQVFDLDEFQYLQSFRINPEFVYHKFDYFDGKWFFFAVNTFGTPHSIHIYDKKFSRITELALPNQIQIKSFTAIPSPPFYKNRDFFHIRTEFNDTIFQYEAGKGISPFLVVDFGKKKIDKRQKEILKQADFDQASRLIGSFDFSRIMHYAETGRYIFISVILSKEKTINKVLIDKKNKTIRQLSDMNFPGTSLPLQCIGVLPNDFFVFAFTDEDAVDELKNRLRKEDRHRDTIADASAFLIFLRFQ